MNTRFCLLLSVLALALLASATPMQAAETGTLRGTVDKPADVKAVSAIDHDSGKRFPGKIDARTGVFTIEGLPLGATYDCIIDTKSARLEGVDLKVRRSDYEEEQPLSKEDIAAIKKIALALNKFENIVEVMTIRGNIQYAAVVLNKQRTDSFINAQPGEMIWRLELWHFEKPEEHWIKSQDELGIVLYRERLQKKDFAKKSLTLDPALGGHRLSGGRRTVDVGKVTLPEAKPGIHLRGEAKKRRTP
jgi:hypothetical protein